MGVDKYTDQETTGGTLKDADIFRYDESNGIGYDTHKHTMLSLKTYVVAGITLATTLASGNDGNNLAITNLNSLAVSTITEQTAGAGISCVTNGGAFAWGGNNVSMSLADDTEEFFMTANGGITFTSAAGMSVNGGFLTAAGGLKANEIQEIVAGDGVIIRSTSGGIMGMQGDNVSLSMNDTADSATLTALSIGLSGNTVVSGYLRVGTTIRTGDPGNGQGEWRLGTAIVGLIGLDTTKHVEVMIDGVLTKLACAS